MKEIKKVAFVTGSRADYGIMRKFLNLMNTDEEIDLKLLVTGALLDLKYGKQVELIYQDGFSIDAEIPLPLNSTSNEQVLHAMAVAIAEFGKYFEKIRYDLLIILGDRYEMLSVAIAAAVQKIPILHIHGGEATYGNYDEFIRHCITKMSLYHFAVTDEYKNRIIQLGEEPHRVFNLGALGAENCMHINKEKIPQNILNYKGDDYFVVLFHPETLTNIGILSQITELLNAIKNNFQYKYVFIGTNADTNSDIIRNAIYDHVKKNRNAIYVENLCTDAYHYLVKNSLGLIGNSSSGIIEAPSLGVYTINIGERQKGRIKGKSVLDVSCNMKEISDAIRKVTDLRGITTNNIENPYYKQNASIKYHATLKQILNCMEMETKHPKEFFDLLMDLR